MIMAKIGYSVLMFLSTCFGIKNSNATKPELMDNKPTKSLYDFKMKSIEGKEIDLAKYKGKKVLIVNVASECGYTPQYKELQMLHEKYGDKVVILGFPANDFGAQEPGSNEQIKTFCEKNYGVTFQMFDKITVKGEKIHPLYKFLSTKEQNGWNDQAPKWNFNKYLINEKGELIKYFGSGVSPTSNEILDLLK
jgi:glutathione peroxidase